QTAARESDRPAGVARVTLRFHLRQRRLGLGEPEGHLHSTVHLQGGRECSAGLLWLTGRCIQRAEAAVTVGLEREHAKLLGQGKGLTVVVSSLTALRVTAMRRNVTEEAHGICLVATFLVRPRECQRALSEGVCLLQMVSQHMRLAEGEATEHLILANRAGAEGACIPARGSTAAPGRPPSCSWRGTPSTSALGWSHAPQNGSILGALPKTLWHKAQVGACVSNLRIWRFLRLILAYTSTVRHNPANTADESRLPTLTMCHEERKVQTQSVNTYNRRHFLRLAASGVGAVLVSRRGIASAA